MKSRLLITHFFLIILFIIFFSSFYYGISPNNPTSPDYNIPLAKIILNGQFINMQHIDSIYLFFPGSSNIILAAFILLHIPLNLFGVFTWVILVLTSIKFARTFGLSKTNSLFFSVSTATCISVIRTINDQSIDKWLCIWFMLAVILLEKPGKNLKYFFTLGIVLGMLIGTKYSGPFFLIALGITYLIPFIKKMNPIKLLFILIPFSLTGLFWYVRNFILLQNPYYPANFFIFKGYPNYSQQDWMLWRIPFSYPEGLWPLFNSYISEYSIWVLAPLLILIYLFSNLRKISKLNLQLKRLLLLILATCLISLLLPITPPSKIEIFHIISDMRYIYIPVFLEILAVFVIAERTKKVDELIIIVFVGAIGVFSFLPYEPKIFIFAACVYAFIYSKYSEKKSLSFIKKVLNKING